MLICKGLLSLCRNSYRIFLKFSIEIKILRCCPLIQILRNFRTHFFSSSVINRADRLISLFSRNGGRNHNRNRT